MFGTGSFGRIYAVGAGFALSKKVEEKFGEFYKEY